MNRTHISMVYALLAMATLVCQSAYARRVDDRGPYARSLSQVQTISVDSNECIGQLDDELDDHGFINSSSSRADGVLEVDVHQLDANMGATARFAATLRGRDGRVLFSTTGREDSFSVAELCEDISEDIFDRMRTRMGG